MNILISNDDGISAIGIHLLAKAFSEVEGARLFICAPDRQRSSIGHAMTINEDLIVSDRPVSGFEGPVVWAKSCSGTPVDCVRIAQYLLEVQGIRPDLVCSGINLGGNAGTDTIQSGTVAVCREAAMAGIPAIAFSSSRGLSHGENFLRIVPDIIKRTAGKLPPKTILNVNCRDLPWAEIKGYRTAKPADMYHPCSYYPVESDDGKTHYKFAGFTLPPPDGHPDSDRTLIDSGYITVSLLPLLPDVAATEDIIEKLFS